MISVIEYQMMYAPQFRGVAPRCQNNPSRRGCIVPRFETADDTSLFYRTYGFDDHSGGTPILCLNGMTQTTMSWKSQANHLVTHAPVITYDARGQGDSEVGEAELTLEVHAGDVAGLLEHLGVEAAHFVGFSHGARVALAAANHHPERMERLVVCSATAEPTMLAQVIVRAWREILELGGLEAMSWAALPTILGDRFVEANKNLIDGIIKASVQRNNPEGVARLLEGMMAYPSLAELAEGVDAPTLVVSGEHDLLVDAEGAAQLAALCGGEHVEIPGVAHTVPIEAPEAFREAIIPFLFDPRS